MEQLLEWLQGKLKDTWEQENAMLNTILEIFLITYNRSESLEETLRRIKESPFAHCRFTILDNCSSDDTSLVAERYRDCFTDYHVVRHSINIGGDANYLRAVELSNSTYTWILCDDDLYDFSAAEEIIEILQEEACDLLVVGPLHPTDMVRKTSSSIMDLVRSGFLPHFTISFFPACIFRTELFDYDCIVRGFRLSAERYPNFAFINKMLQKNVQVYIPSAEIVIRNDVNVSVLSPLSWYLGWLNCCLTIPDRRLRYANIEQATAKRGFLKSLGFWIILERHIDPGQFYRKIFNIYFTLSLGQRLRLLLLLPVIAIPLPLSLMVLVRRYVYRLMGVPESEVPPVEVMDRDA